MLDTHASHCHCGNSVSSCDSNKRLCQLECGPWGSGLLPLSLPLRPHSLSLTLPPTAAPRLPGAPTHWPASSPASAIPHPDRAKIEPLADAGGRRGWRVKPVPTLHPPHTAYRPPHMPSSSFPRHYWRFSASCTRTRTHVCTHTTSMHGLPAQVGMRQGPAAGQRCHRMIAVTASPVSPTASTSATQR